MRTLLLLLFTLVMSPVHAWNALGHKVIADIAWNQLDELTQQQIVRTLRRHPRFDEDFAKKGDISDDRWVFQQAAVWPDIARGQSEFDQPTWHYINHPVFAGAERPVDFNLTTVPKGAAKSWNIAQAINYCRKIVKSDAAPSQKALAYSWLLHLVGDLHQPMHSTALVCERFPDGDRGGNSILLHRGENLHSLWDNFLGRQHRPNDIKREMEELRWKYDYWRIDDTRDVANWIEESHDLAESFAYCPAILQAAAAKGEFQPVELDEKYLKAAGEHARRRVVAAGLRLGELLQESTTDANPNSVADFQDAAAPSPKSTSKPVEARVSAPSPAPPAVTHWLNLSGNVRHNSSCRWYNNTKRGRMCSASEGHACGQCGG